MVLKIQDVGVGCDNCFKVLSHPCLHSVCVCTCACIQCCEFMLIHTIPIWHHSIHSSFLPLYIFNSQIVIYPTPVLHMFTYVINLSLCNHCQHTPPSPHGCLPPHILLWHPALGLLFLCGCHLQPVLILSARPPHHRDTLVTLPGLWHLVAIFSSGCMLFSFYLGCLLCYHMPGCSRLECSAHTTWVWFCFCQAALFNGCLPHPVWLSTSHSGPPELLATLRHGGLLCSDSFSAKLYRTLFG